MSCTGDCTRFGKDVLAAGERACSCIASWVASTSKQAKTNKEEDAVAFKGDSLSVWSVSWDGAPAQVEYSMLAHALLSPYRIIVVRLEGLDHASSLFRFRKTSDMILDFVVFYEWLHGLNISWDTCLEVRLNMHTFDVAAWNAMHIRSAATSQHVIWKLRQERFPGVPNQAPA